ICINSALQRHVMLGGAGNWRPEYNTVFTNKNVAVIPDNDEAGQKHAQVVARNLLAVAKSVRIVPLPNLPPKGDVSDWLEAGGTKNQLLALVRATPALTPESIPADQPGAAVSEVQQLAETLKAKAGELLAGTNDPLKIEVVRAELQQFLQNHGD